MRGLGIILAGTLGAGVALGGPAGYLPRVGPVSLRFQAPRSVTRVELPPLQMQDALPPLTQTPDVVMSQPTEPDPIALESVAAGLSTAPTNLLNQALTNAPSPAAYFNIENTGVLSPQMFLRFFTPAASGAGHEVVVPVPPGFNPAQPGQPVSSSATYTLSKP